MIGILAEMFIDGERKLIRAPCADAANEVVQKLRKYGHDVELNILKEQDMAMVFLRTRAYLEWLDNLMIGPCCMYDPNCFTVSVPGETHHFTSYDHAKEFLERIKAIQRDKFLRRKLADSRD